MFNCFNSFIQSRFHFLPLLVMMQLAIVPALRVIGEETNADVARMGNLDVAVPSLTGEGWTSLFDGKDLKGWIQRNGWATYRIVDGTIEGTTSDRSPNSFLCTEKSYSNFIFTVDVKCDPQLNSGIQIRSASVAERDHGRVFGPQVEIAPGVAGYIYGESTGRNWLSPTQPSHKHFDPEKWNTYVIQARGNRMQTWINGVMIEDIEDRLAPESGFIGLQVHGVDSAQGPYRVQWRNIKISELKKD